MLPVYINFHGNKAARAEATEKCGCFAFLFFSWLNLQLPLPLRCSVFNVLGSQFALLHPKMGQGLFFFGNTRLVFFLCNSGEGRVFAFVAALVEGLQLLSLVHG